MKRLKNGRAGACCRIEPHQGEQRQADAHADDRLPGHLIAGPQPVMGTPHNLQVVVGKPDGAERRRGDHRDPDGRVGQVRPKKRREDCAGEDQQAAHRRRPGLGAVGLRSILPDHLADLELAQPPDHHRAEDQAQGQGRHARARRAEGDGMEERCRIHI